MPQFALQLRQISKTYGELRANNSIDFQVKTGTIHALAGENGAGKSTLMKILFGLVEPDYHPDQEAGIFIKGEKVKFKSPLDAIKSGVGMVQQHFALAGPLTALDNIILGAEPRKGVFVDRGIAEKKLNQLAGTFLRVPWNQAAEDLSVGMQQRLEILKLLFREADILILDEPTAVLTPQEVEVFFSLLRNLKAEGKTIILITHKLHEVLELADEVTVLRQGRVTGNFSTLGLGRGQIVEAMIGREIRPVVKESVKRGEAILSVRDLCVEQVHRGSLKGVNLEVRRGEIVGIAGVEGNGQQALVESILALAKKSRGEIRLRGEALPSSTCVIRNKLGVGLISEDRHEQSLWLDASIKENVAIGFCGKLSRFGFLGSKKLTANALGVLKNYHVAMSSVEQPIRFLSGGNQQKVVVAREVTAKRPEFLIAVQPTRGVDVGAIEFIHQQLLDLKKRDAGVLLISSELEELCALSDRILVLFEGRVVGEFPGPDFDAAQMGLAMTGGASA